ncbi:rhodanese-like domain-containing protein [Jannaschia sp. S6380]|uniref:rhodanese-like domain-containing protein n=1 Tax=Jannaschia sp. S6380 TaxID=2926408 RepID=UPI001FF60EDB|nr:rhodanese-like domain-containing protein [Jannaschia sp. S6380]MCK0166731.1 rhodanese-like domain-containing protein [Jannaschia sp. S6380]
MTDARPFVPSRRNLLLGGVALLGLGAVSATAVARRDRFAGEEMTPPQALAAARADDLLLVDIRRPEEWARTGIPEGATPIDMRRDDFIEVLSGLTGADKDRPVALICARGVRSDRLGARLASAGFARIVDVPEGMLGSDAGPGWLDRGLPVRHP